MDSFWTALASELDSMVSANPDRKHHEAQVLQRDPEKLTPLQEAAEALEQFKSKNRKHRRRGKKK